MSGDSSKTALEGHAPDAAEWGGKRSDISGDKCGDGPGDAGTAPQDGRLPASPPGTHLLVATNPFLEALGVEVLRADTDGCELRLGLDGWHLNRWDIAHGGVTMTLLDAALGQAARTADGGARGVVTVDMSVTFVQPGRGTLRAEGRVLHRSTTMAYCDGEVYAEDGALVAKAIGTFKYLRKLAVGRDIREARRD